MNHHLEVDSVMLNFGTRQILQNVFLQNRTGEITGLVGRNGSGKSCLLNVIYGTLQASDQSIRIDQKHLSQRDINPHIIRYLPQFNFIPKSFSMQTILQDFNINTDAFITDFPEFRKYYKTPINKLSGGEQRIIEIYSVLASPTQFCLLDEPFSQVMPIHIKTLKRVMQREKKNKGLIISDHLYQHLLDICDNITLIKDGQTISVHNVNDLIKLGYLES